MTLDDLVKIYNDKVFEVLAVGDISLTVLDAKRAGICAIIKRMRDEYTEQGVAAIGSMSWNAFNEILGDDEEAVTMRAILAAGSE